MWLCHSETWKKLWFSLFHFGERLLEVNHHEIRWELREQSHQLKHRDNLREAVFECEALTAVIVETVDKNRFIEVVIFDLFEHGVAKDHLVFTKFSSSFQLKVPVQFVTSSLLSDSARICQENEWNFRL